MDGRHERHFTKSGGSEDLSDIDIKSPLLDKDSKGSSSSPVPDKKMIVPDNDSIFLDLDSSSLTLHDDKTDWNDTSLVSTAVTEDGTEGPEKILYKPNLVEMCSLLEKEMKSKLLSHSPSPTIENFSLEEVRHIRRAHVKADIESLPDQGSTKRDVIRGKLCLPCLKTKFTIFRGGLVCEICSQVVCQRCVRKVSTTSLLTPGPTSAASPGSILRLCLDCSKMVASVSKPGEAAKREARAVMLGSLASSSAGQTL